MIYDEWSAWGFRTSRDTLRFDATGVGCVVGGYMWTRRSGASQFIMPVYHEYCAMSFLVFGISGKLPDGRPLITYRACHHFAEAEQAIAGYDPGTASVFERIM